MQFTTGMLQISKPSIETNDRHALVMFRPMTKLETIRMVMGCRHGFRTGHSFRTGQRRCEALIGLVLSLQAFLLGAAQLNMVMSRIGRGSSRSRLDGVRPCWSGGWVIRRGRRVGAGETQSARCSFGVLLSLLFTGLPNEVEKGRHLVLFLGRRCGVGVGGGCDGGTLHGGSSNTRLRVGAAGRGSCGGSIQAPWDEWLVGDMKRAGGRNGEEDEHYQG